MSRNNARDVYMERFKSLPKEIQDELRLKAEQVVGEPPFAKNKLIEITILGMVEKMRYE